MSLNVPISQFTYSKHDVITFLMVVSISTIVTLSPVVTLHYVDLDMAFFFIIITQTLIATLFYLFYLKKFTECEIRIKTDAATIKFSSISFSIIILIQLAVYCYRDYLYHYEPYHLNWIAVLVATLLVPYYEEIIYRACAFGFFCSVYKKNIIIPCVITSLFFSLMHFQYYNIVDQSVLFVVSMLLLGVRIKSRSLFYPMLIHSGMNAFVILLNAQKII